MKARIEAAKALSRILREGAYANRLIDATLERSQGDARDHGFFTEIVYGVLRHLFFLDRVIDQYAKQGVESIDPAVLDHLRVAVYQLLFLERVPSHAAVDEAVQAVRGLRGKVVAGFVNGVLRKVAGKREERPLPDPLTDLAEYLSVRESHPLWLVERYLRVFGPDKTQRRLAINNTAPTMTLRVNPLWGTREALLARLKTAGIEGKETEFSGDGIRIEASQGAAIQRLFREEPKAFVVQDEAAQVVSLWLAGEESEREGVKKVLDACSAPGGKATHLAALFPEAEVVALDIHPQKIEVIRGTCKRLGLRRVEARVADAQDPSKIPPGPYERILCDAPCSGLGVLRKHPDIRYRATGEKVQDLAGLQKRLLEALAPHVAVGGILVYSLCTDTEEEGPEQVRAFLGRHPEYRVERGEVRQEWAGLFDEEGFLKTRPEDHGMDAFFGARLKRVR